MDLNRLSAQQQWMILFILAALLVSPYAIKRFWPAYQTLQKNQKHLTKNQDTIKTPNYPESPVEDEEDVRADIEDAQAIVHDLSSRTDSIQNRIGPAETQDILLELSAAARVNNINIIDNVPYVVQRVGMPDTSKNAKKTKPASASTTGHVRMSKSEQRESRVRQRVRGAGQAINTTAMMGTPPREGELIYDVVNKLDEARPLQLMSLQGTYFGLMGFIESIRNLPVQVTLVNLSIDTQVQIPSQNQQNMQGLPQLIRVSLILAL
ncbi:MAG: hypothetical protein Q7V02_01510 [Methylophilus sp.]|nr:hypothetical protein [Methylophilus sp.]